MKGGKRGCAKRMRQGKAEQGSLYRAGEERGS